MFDRILIILATLLFLTAEKTNSRNFCCSPMEISDALPVQFWLNGCQTFNEYKAPGVYHKCFFAPWECEDEIFVQFKDDPSQDFSLEIYNDQQLLLGTLQFDETAVGVYEARYNIGEDSPDVCDELIYLQIKRDQGLQGFTLPPLSDYVNAGGSGDPWTLGSSPSIVTTLGGTNTERLYVPYAFIPGVTYTINVVFSNTQNTVGIFTVGVMNDSNLSQFNETTSGGNTGLNQAEPFVFTATSDTTRLYVDVNFFGNNTTTIVSISGVRTVGDSQVMAKTDLLNVQRDHDDTILLTYTNHRNFAGLVYAGISPQTEFQIRIPAIFFHQRFPEEDEVAELSTELITLNGTVRKQRQLTTDYLPYYFHEKLKLILKHQSISILNREWVKQEAYEIVEGQKRFPLKVANCWLSEKEFVHRNVL